MSGAEVLTPDAFALEGNIEPTPETEGLAEPNETLQAYLDRAAVSRIRAALDAAKGNRTIAATTLGVDRTTLYRLMSVGGCNLRAQRRKTISLRRGRLCLLKVLSEPKLERVCLLGLISTIPPHHLGRAGASPAVAMRMRRLTENIYRLTICDCRFLDVQRDWGQTQFTSRRRAKAVRNG